MTEQLSLVGTLKGHSGWVTSIATPSDASADYIVSGSRDKTVIVWKLTRQQGTYGAPKRALRGHNHFVEDIALSSDGNTLISASWDKTLRMWDVNSGKTIQTFVGHTSDVLSVSFSPDNRQVVSGSRDKTIRVWNISGESKQVWTEGGHSEWVSCVRFTPNVEAPVVVSCGWDKLVKVWDLSKGQVLTNHIGHTGFVNAVTVSPDGSLSASGGKDGVLMLWDLNVGKHLTSLEAGNIIHALAFSPVRYWLCVATDSCIKIWDLANRTIVEELRPEFNSITKDKIPACISLAWSADGRTLFSGYTDNEIRVWQISQSVY